ncbi:MAG: zf-HC2 domain-containing protein [Chloroflexi bacterium]|nr:zf-HC2 domain-containing protein [Chloroflexota bacterium]
MTNAMRNPQGQQHPYDRDLGAYLDGELDLRGAWHLSQHLAGCPECAARLAELKALSQRVREAGIDLRACSSAGDFWVRLAGRLSLQREGGAFGWLNFLPPFLLNVLAWVGQGVLAVSAGLYLLVRIGLLPPLGQAVLQRLAQWAKSSLIAGTLSAWLGVSEQQISEMLYRASAQGDTWLFGVILLIAFVYLVATWGMYLFWAICWRRGAISLRKSGGR